MFTLLLFLLLTCTTYLTVKDCFYRFRTPSSLVRRQVKWAEQAYLVGRVKEAEAVLKPLIGTGKGGKEARLLYLRVLRGTGALLRALEAAVEAARRYPEELQFRMEEGLILLELSRFHEALEAFQVCSPILRGEEDMWALGRALYHAGHLEQAFLILAPWEGETENGGLLSLLGDIYYDKHAWQEATLCYLRARERGYKTHESTIQLAHAYRRLGNLAESEHIFRTLLEKEGGDLHALLGLGACMQERGHFHKALLLYQTSLFWEQQEVHLMREAGFCALRMQKYQAAETFFHRVISACDGDPLTLSYYALALEGQQKWQEAEQVYLQLIQQHPSYPHGYRALAWLFGVGLSYTLSSEQGINYAYIASKMKNDPISWEILSACEARVGNFSKAYAIQTHLAAKDNTREARSRRQQIFRKLRKHHPLEEHQVVRSLVA